MKIETKFNVTETVYIMRGTNLWKADIYKVEATQEQTEAGERLEINYFFKLPNDNSYDILIKKEHEVFSSEEEFLNQLTIK